MYAIISAGGQQHRVSPGDILKVQGFVTNSEKELNFDKILLVSKNKKIIIGNPFIKNASVKAKILGTEKSSKIYVFKQKPRKGFRKLNGHRQNYTVVKIKNIDVGG
jgi:large subunit ribosomal protein L21